MTEATWFSARLLFKSSVEDVSGTAPLYEESIILVKAENEAGARVEAERFARANEHGYLNAEGTQVRWRFIRLLEVQDLCEETLSNGVEVYSRLFRSASEPE